MGTVGGGRQRPRLPLPGLRLRKASLPSPDRHLRPWPHCTCVFPAPVYFQCINPAPTPVHTHYVKFFPSFAVKAQGRCFLNVIVTESYFASGICPLSLSALYLAGTFGVVPGSLKVEIFCLMFFFSWFLERTYGYRHL